MASSDWWRAAVTVLDELDAALRSSQLLPPQERRSRRSGRPKTRSPRALVDNADVSSPLGIIVAEDDVDLVPLERGFVAVVVHADGEVATSRGCLA
jgi:hypothetical protein